jgi:hypothetical protein
VYPKPENRPPALPSFQTPNSDSPCKARRDNAIVDSNAAGCFISAEHRPLVRLEINEWMFFTDLVELFDEDKLHLTS